MQAKFRIKKTQLFVLSALGFLYDGALAQDQSDSTKSVPINEVVITANRVQTSAQKTAVSVSAYSGDALADAGVSTIQALQSIDPSVNMTNTNGAAYIAVRGIASTDVTEIGDPSVPVARDGFFVNRSFSLATSMYDIERVEVLKGPQGTLFGRNSTGGLVNIISKQPGKTKEGYLSTEFGNYNTINIDGAYNFPLSARVQLRVAGISHKHDGYRKLTGVEQRIDDDNTKSARIALAVQPIDGLNALLTYQHDQFDMVGDAAKNLPLETVTPLGDTKSWVSNAPISNQLNGNRARVEMNYDRLPGGMSVTYAGGYDKQEWHHLLDSTGPIYPAARQFIQSEEPATINHEVRFATRQDQDLSAQFGYFYFKETNHVVAGIYNLAMNPGIPVDKSNRYGIRFIYDIQTKSQAWFGQVGYKLSSNLKLTAGVRRTRDQKHRTGDATIDLGALISPFIPAPPVVTPDNGKVDESKPTYSLGLEWNLARDNFLYAKYGTGYKSGGFNTNGTGPSIPYSAENVKTFEVGSKNRFFDRKALFNVSLFSTDYRDYQASQTTESLGGNAGVFNVGSAKIIGAEFEAAARIGDWKYDANAAFLTTRFGNGITVSDGAGKSRSISGHALPNAPHFVMTAGIERFFTMEGGTVTARLFGKYSSKFYYSVFNDEDASFPSTTTLNAVATYLPDNSPWQLQLYSNNLTDKVVLANAYRNYRTHLNSYEFQPPRTFGIRLKYNF